MTPTVPIPTSIADACAAHDRHRLDVLDTLLDEAAPSAVRELLGAALDELEASLPYVQGNKVVASDEQGDPLYEDIGLTPRFLALSRRHLQRLSEQQKQAG